MLKNPTLWVVPSTSVVEYLNVLSLSTAVTKNVPLYPWFTVADVLVVLLTFFTITWSPISKSCGSSVIAVTTLDASVHVLINLWLRL